MHLLARSTFLLVLVMIVPLLVAAQNGTSSIRGVITNEKNNRPLYGANVIVLDSEDFFGASTDGEGTFTITGIPYGTYSLKMSYLGFQEKTIHDVIVGGETEAVVVVRLVESATDLDEVVVKAHRDEMTPVDEMSVVSTRAISMESGERQIASNGDPARMVTAFAGVNGGDNNDQNEVVVRGNSARGVLWMVDGVEVPSPNHYTEPGASSGSLSMLNSKTLGTSDFSTGAFNAQYGNALSAVFDMKMRIGNTERRKHSIMASVIGFDAMTEGPFVKGKKASYIMNVRYNSLRMVEKLGIELNGLKDPKFADFSFKLNFPTKNKGVFAVYGLGGTSELLYTNEGLLSTGKEDITNTERVVYDMVTTGVSHKYVASEKLYFQTNLSLSGAYSLHRLETRDRQDYFFTTDRTETLNFYLRGAFTVNNKFNEKHHLRSGLIFTQHMYDLQYDAIVLDTANRSPIVDDMGNTQVVQAFTTWKFNITNRLSLLTGLHSSYFHFNQTFTLEPRMGLQYMIDEDQTINAGFGMHSRREDMLNYFSRTYQTDGTVSQPNLDMEYAKAIHYVLGYDNKLDNHMHFRLELYFQYLYNLPVEPGGPASALNEKVGVFGIDWDNVGRGENYGAEVTIEKFFSKAYYFMFTGSFFNSKYTGGDGIKRNTRYNTNFVTNFMVGRRIPVGKEQKNYFDIGTRVYFAGGRRYTPLDENGSAAQQMTVLNTSQSYAKRGPVNYRIDAGASFHLETGKITHTIRLDVSNVTNHENVIEVDYDPIRGRVDDKRGQIIPIFSYRIDI